MKKHIFSIMYSIILIAFTIYMVLDTLVITKVYTVVEMGNIEKQVESNELDKILITSDSYEDDNITIKITKYNENDTQIYVADIEVTDSKYLRTAFANNTYGKNITAKTSTIANKANAILAINGDYYGVQESGYVIKSGVIYRNKAKSNKEDLVIYKDGSFEIINESQITAEELLEKGVYNLLSFGPALLENGEVTVSTKEEVARAKSSNPRTAIGIISENHYIFVVSDGRTGESDGLTLYELATFMKKLGAEIAYNLDGGGSSTMYFNGEIINNPTTNGKISERSVSDIVYIGY